MPPKKTISVEQFLADYHPNVQELANLLRAVMQQALPEAHEAAYPGWRLIGYRVPKTSGSKKDVYIGYIAPLETHVSLGFEWGILMDDPHNILEGQGKQVRYITIRTPQDIDPARLMSLIQEAARVAQFSPVEKATRIEQRN